MAQNHHPSLSYPYLFALNHSRPNILDLCPGPRFLTKFGIVSVNFRDNTTTDSSFDIQRHLGLNFFLTTAIEPANI